MTVNADSVLDVLENKAKEESNKRNQEIGQQELDEIGKELAKAALRFSLLKIDITNMLVFSTKESLRLDGDSGPYLLYTHARAVSITRKVGKKEIKEYDAALLTHTSEKELIKEISKYSRVVKQTVETLSPKLLAIYSLKLSDKFNVFYESCQVLHAETEALANARLALVNVFINVFSSLLDLMGITSLGKM